MKKRHHLYRESHIRTIIKAITWGTLGVIVLSSISFFVTKSAAKSTGITILFYAIRFIMYYIHERVWTAIQWGKPVHPLIGFSVRDDLTKEELEVIEKFLRERQYLKAHPEYEI